MPPTTTPRRNPRYASRAALTLLELVLVLVIMAALATVAVETLEPQVDQARFKTTQQTIENVEDAIVAEKTSANGTDSYTGFVADLGRLPQARADGSGTALLLSELWLQPAGVARFAVRPADSAEGGVPAGQEDPEVRVACGWNGPYLELPVGSNNLHDGWGTPLVTALPAGSSYSHLRSRDPSTGQETDVTAEDDPVYGVRSLGRNNVFDPTDRSYDADIPANLRITDGRISGVAQGNVTVDGDPPTDQRIVVQMYGPDGATGLVRVDRYPSGGFSDAASQGLASYTFDDSDPEHNLKVGPHAFRAYWDENGDGQIDSSDPRSQIVYLNIRPGMNLIRDLNIASGTP